MNSHSTHCAAVILAAGIGKRMGGNIPKVLREIGNMPMVGHVALSAARAGCDSIALVVSQKYAEEIVSTTRSVLTQHDVHIPLSYVVQQTPRGTGDAARIAWQHIVDTNSDGDKKHLSLLVLNGDSALIATESMAQLKHHTTTSSCLSLLAFTAEDPTGYGRNYRQRSWCMR